jgi:cysteine desulfurase/selenocysteine lyase
MSDLLSGVASQDEAVPFDVEAIRKDFPILSRTVRNGKPLVYLDSGATSQHPTVVLDAEREYYERHNAAAHRGTHLLGQEATEIYEGARAKVAAFLGARPDEVVFTKSATEGINLVSFGLGSGGPAAMSLRPGDEILISEIEHHANLVPWQQLALRTGATLKWFRELPDGRLDVDPSLVTSRTKVVAVTGQSNVTGVIPPLREIGELAHSVGALFLVDGAQLVPHHPVDVASIGADFLAFSGHKMLGPLGLGVLYGRYAALDALPPFLTGGSMIEVVRMEETTFLPPPAKFEPGVPAVSLAAGLGAAVDYLTALGMDNVAAHEESLTAHALAALGEIDGVRILGPLTTENRGGTVAFEVEGVHAHDVGQVLDELGIAIRTGHHCAWPLHRTLGCQASNRASFYLYNTHAEVDALADGIRYAKKFFRA